MDEEKHAMPRQPDSDPAAESPKAQELSLADRALARSRLYQLCQQLYVDGLTTETLPTVMALPDLAAHVPHSAADRRTATADQLAANHQTLFGFQLFPYESIFLGTDGLLGGAISEAVRAAYTAAAHEPTGRAGAPDHLGEQLGLLAHLCTAEAEAWADEQLITAQRLQQTEHHFLRSHLLRWLVPCTTAIQRHADPFYTQLATITVALVANHYTSAATSTATSTATFTATAADTPTTWTPPAPPALLADSSTSLKDIVNCLTTPLHSGLFLSRHLIEQLGRAHRIPRGFGSRQQMLTNLLRTAAQYERLPALLQSLQDELLVWQQSYRALLAEQPLLAPFVQPWLARLRGTEELLNGIDMALLLQENEENDAS